MKKFLKQPLFWSTIILGVTTIIFAFATYALAERVSDMDSALSKYNSTMTAKIKTFIAIVHLLAVHHQLKNLQLLPLLARLFNFIKQEPESIFQTD